MSAVALSTMQGSLSKRSPSTTTVAALGGRVAPALPRRRQTTINDRRVGVADDSISKRRFLIPPSHASTFQQQDQGIEDLTTEAEKAAEAVAKASHGAPFDWLAHWYPVALESATPKDRPTAVKLLGRELVLWHDGSNWRCFEDRCPHRAVPLSEGRVETAAAEAAAKGKKGAKKSLPKELQCAYHGFQFAFDGSCTAVPQALSAKEEQRAKASPRACAAVHPVRHCGDGLLWAWPVAGDFVRAGATPTGEHSLLDAAFPDAADAAPSSSSSSADGGSVVFLSPWFTRDVPFDADVLAENVVDPSHVFFSHHGVLGSRYAPPMQQMIPPPPLPRGMRPDPAADPVAEAEEAGGFAVQQLLHGPRRPSKTGGLPADPPPDAGIPASKRDRFDKKHGTILWKPPTQARYDFSHGAHMIVHGTPLERGKTRLFFAVYRRRDATPALMRFVLGILSSPPLRFLAHHGNNNVLDGDNVFIAAQGATLRSLEARGKSFRDVYFMPTSMDAAVARVRGWFARHGGFSGFSGAERARRSGRGIPWRGEEEDGGEARQPAPPTRYEALERWNSHTKHCPDCMRAFRTFSLLRNAAAGICGTALAWAIGSAAAAVASASAAAAATSSAAAASSFRSRVLSAAPAVAPSLAVAGAAAVAFFVLRKEVQKFIYVDYVHADHD